MMVIKMENIKQKVKEKIKKYSNDAYLDGYIKNEFLTSDGNADILLVVNNRDELIDSRTVSPQLAINKSVFDFIDEKSSMLNNDIVLKLVIIGNCFSEKDKGKIKHIISEHYAIELYKIQKAYRRYKTKIFRLAMLGIIFLSCYAITSIGLSSMFFLEVFGFLFSFTLWEAFDTYIYPFSDLKLEREATTQKLIMEVEFKEESKKE